MNFSRFFIDRPIFAAVIAIFITLIGAFAFPRLAVSQYPEIAPPTIVIQAPYAGASAEVIAETVAAPLEQEINGVERMLYIQSSATQGVAQITVTFQPGTDLNAAQVMVQNRVRLAEPRLPEQVRQVGVTVNKQSTGFLLIGTLTAEEGSGLDIDYLGNYAQTVVRERLLRLEGVGDVTVFGGGRYSMRVWIDPSRAANRDLTAPEIVSALRAQNVQVAGGSLGQAPADSGNPAFEVPVDVQGRLGTADEFADVVLKSDPVTGSITRLRDVARVELGNQDYGIRAFYNGDRSVALAVIQQPGANALNAATLVEDELKAMSADFPAGMTYAIPYNPTEFVAASVAAVESTLLEAVVLVMLVVMVFLQTWRAAIIPIIAIPVSLVGTFAVLLALGFSINSLSLFALVLAVGIVVDDAIVVVEAVEKHVREGLSPREAAHRTMQEVSGALIAIGLVLVSVFVPTAFTPGIPGIFFREFAVTIAASAVISLLVSLTLSPALAALLLKPHKETHVDHGSKLLRPFRVFATKFNDGFDWLSDRYGRFTARAVRTLSIMLIVYVGLLALTGWRLTETPTGFIPEQDQGILIGVVQMPPGASLDRTNAVLDEAYKTAMAQDGVESIIYLAGLDGTTQATSSNSGTIFMRLKDWDERGKELSAKNIAGILSGKLAALTDKGNIFMVSPPAVSGLGNGSGFVMMVQDRSGAGYRALEDTALPLMGAAAQQPDTLNQVYTTYNTGTPRIRANVDRDRAQMLGVQPDQVYAALGTYLASSYVNDFNLAGRTYRVTAQAESDARNTAADIGQLKVRSSTGNMVPLSSVATLEDDSGPARVIRFNLFPSYELQGQAAPGVSSGQAIGAIEKIADENLPDGFGYEWTGIAYQEKAAGNSSALVFGMAVVFVFLVLAAQYESITLPLAVILIVPMCILAAMIGVNIRGMDNNILTQVGLVVLIALAAKNAILIVEYAKQGEDRGLKVVDAAVAAAKARLRPILMTSFAFIFGVLPLAIATGPGAEMRQSIGTAVVSGMLGVTVFGLIFTPVFYVLTRGFGRSMRYRRVKSRRAHQLAERNEAGAVA